MRKTYLDNIKWITVVLVVIYHVIYMYNGIEIYGIGPFSDRVQYQDAFQYMVYPWFMVLLFVVSGMSSRFYLSNHTHKEFIKTRTVKLLVPSTIGLFVFQWILGYYNMLIGGAFEQMGAVPKPVLYIIMSISGIGTLWYIQLLWIFSLALVLVRKLEGDKLYHLCSRANIAVLVLLTILIYGSAQILNTPVIVVYRFGIYGASFFIGYFFLSHDEVADRLGKWWIPLASGAAVLMAAYLMAYWKKPFAEHEVLDTFLCNAFAWITTLAIIAFMSKYGNFSNAFCRFMNEKSWGLYIFHYLAIAACAWNLHVYTANIPAGLTYLITAAAAFAGAYILYEIISRIPLLRWCVLGMKKKRVKENV